MTFQEHHRLQQLRQFARSGLGNTPAHDFLLLTAPSALQDLDDRSVQRLLVLRLTLQRQHFAFAEALETIGALEEQADLAVDDAFMFACESVRVFLGLNRDGDAIASLLHAAALHPDVSGELQDYLLVTQSVLCSFLGDHEQRLQVSLRVQRTPPPGHPYHLNLNPGLVQGNVTWARVVTGDLEAALPGALTALADIRTRYPGGGTHAQFEVNTLHLRAMLGQTPDPAEFTQVRDLLRAQGNTGLSSSLLTAEALAAGNAGRTEEAHALFGQVLDLLRAQEQASRVPLLLYDQALAFYRARGNPEELVPVLEGRMRVVEAMQRQSHGMFLELERQAFELNRIRGDLVLSQADLITRLSAIGERRDDATGQHLRRVATLVLHLARALDLPDADLIAEAARLHDLGKVSLPDSILLKAGPLTPGEREVMQQHTTHGAELLAGGTSRVLMLAQSIALHHHERWDGTGYPHQLRGEAIPLPARLVAVADVFDALLSERPYKRAWPLAEALGEMRRLSGTHFEPRIVQALERVLDTVPQAADA